jgi:acyl-CoA synthetase (NDP forming)
MTRLADAPLDFLFGARTVALVGASDRPRSWGLAAVERLRDGGFSGQLIPINPRVESILGIPCYPSLSSAPGPIDLVVLMVAPDRIPGIVEEAAAIGVKAIIAQPGGFAENGDHGRALEDRIASVLDAHAIRFIGPNTAGISDTRTSLNTYFHDLPRPGELALVYQGGGVGSYMSEVARGRDIGVSKVLSLGNQLRTDLIDCVEWLRGDPDTKSVAVQVEGAPRSRQHNFMRDLVEALAELRKTKGVAVIHTGRGKTSSNLTYSHTSSLATPRRLFEGACRQHGVCLAATAADAVVLANMMQYKDARGGRNIAVIGSGSQSMYMADLCEEYRLALPAFSGDLAKRIAAVLRHDVPVRNPLDLGMQNLSILIDVLRMLLAEDGIDAVLYSVPSAAQAELLPPEQASVLWSDLVTASRGSRKPMIGVEWFGATNAHLRKRFEQDGQVLTDTPEEAVRLLHALSTCLPSRASRSPPVSDAAMADPRIPAG